MRWEGYSKRKITMNSDSHDGAVTCCPCTCAKSLEFDTDILRGNNAEKQERHLLCGLIRDDAKPILCYHLHDDSVHHVTCRTPPEQPVYSSSSSSSSRDRTAVHTSLCPPTFQCLALHSPLQYATTLQVWQGTSAFSEVRHIPQNLNGASSFSKCNDSTLLFGSNNPVKCMNPRSSASSSADFL